MWKDARLPLRFGTLDTRMPDEAVLTDAPGTGPGAWATVGPGHESGCACCAGRSGVAVALAGLFRQRAISAGSPFQGVLAVLRPENAALLRHALAEDPAVFVRYRAA